MQVVGLPTLALLQALVWRAAATAEEPRRRLHGSRGQPVRLRRAMQAGLTCRSVTARAAAA